MSETTDTLEELIEERAAKIKSNQGHIVSLQDEIEVWQAEIRGLEMAVKVCNGGESTSHNGTPPLIGKYAKIGLTDAVLDAVQTYGVQPGLTARELVDKLKSEGFKTESKDLYNSVYPVAMGLIEQDRIKEWRKDGKRTFMRK
jgi:hypothetical protein